MWTYSVFNHPTLGYKAIRQDAQPLGFLLSFLWLAYQKVWGKAFICFIAVVLSIDIWTFLFGIAGQFIPAILMSLFIGFKSGTWIEESLLRRGYEKLASIEAKSADSAIASLAKKESDNA